MWKTWYFAHRARQGLPMSRRKGYYTLLTLAFTNHWLTHSNQVYLDCLELLMDQNMWSCPLNQHSLGGFSHDQVCCCSYIPWTCHNCLVVNFSRVVDIVAHFFCSQGFSSLLLWIDLWMHISILTCLMIYSPRSWISCFVCHSNVMWRKDGDDTQTATLRSLIWIVWNKKLQPSNHIWYYLSIVYCEISLTQIKWNY